LSRNEDFSGGVNRKCRPERNEQNILEGIERGHILLAKAMMIAVEQVTIIFLEQPRKTGTHAQNHTT
jgi:hypothetical protein